MNDECIAQGNIHHPCNEGDCTHILILTNQAWEQDAFMNKGDLFLITNNEVCIITLVITVPIGVVLADNWTRKLKNSMAKDQSSLILIGNFRNFFRRAHTLRGTVRTTFWRLRKFCVWQRKGHTSHVCSKAQSVRDTLNDNVTYLQLQKKSSTVLIWDILQNKEEKNQ